MTSSNLKALLIEDSENDVILLLNDLKKAEFVVESKRVEIESDLRKALEEDWDIIFCDYMLPEFNALEALKICKDIAPETPFFIISGVIGEETAVQAMLAGADDYFRKGTLSRLPHAIRRALQAVEERKLKRQTEEAKKLLESQLRQAQKMDSIGRLASGIAHDFNNILASILGYTELAQFHLVKNQNPTEDLKQIHDATLRARSIVRQMLDFARPSKEMWHTISLADLADEAMKLLETACGHNVELKKNLDKKNDTVSADPTQIYQLIINLVTNALQAIPKDKPGCVEISNKKISGKEARQFAENVESAQDYVMLQVKDNGHGIPSQFLDKILDPFFSTKDPKIGTGLGLWSVKNIVDTHKGQLHISSSPESGSTFTVLLPMAEAKPQAEVQALSSMTDDHSGQKELLFVDNETSLAELAKIILTEMGFKVFVTTNSTEALDVFTKNPQRFSIIVTDDIMPGISGLELIDKMRHIYPSFKAILTSSHSQPDIVKKAEDTDISVVEKPYSLTKMLEAIKTLSKAQKGSPLLN